MEENKEKNDLEPAPKEKIFTVSEFLDFLNTLIIPQQVIIKGEVGKPINSYPAYTFIKLLDKEGSLLECFIRNDVIDSLGIPLEEGTEIKVVGYPEIRKRKGELNFQVQRIEFAGKGELKRQFEILKQRLSESGYFKEELKRPLPRFCGKIGLIASGYGMGAKKDFETHLGKFNFHVFFRDTRMEGAFSVGEIIESINWFNQNMSDLDVLVLTRGGGDWESLQPFNNEEIVKVIRASKIPIITGIGHENDTTLADLAADVRASTPTHAAMILSENWQLAAKSISEIKKNISNTVKIIFKNAKEKADQPSHNWFSRIQNEIAKKEKGLDILWQNITFNFQNYLKEFNILEKDFYKNTRCINDLIKKQESKINQLLINLIRNEVSWQSRISKDLEQMELNLKQASPILKLKQGYTITKDQFGKIVKDPQKLEIEQTIATQFYKGQIISKIKKINK
ncbi:MAG: exodeoxyribonuclease VII large subunit [Candidatus Pacebacteria bacterium]|nr:exodeoxyribonuclease VII large subunit [Candidatus Paceibacterota bacterium]